MAIIRHWWLVERHGPLKLASGFPRIDDFPVKLVEVTVGDDCSVASNGAASYVADEGGFYSNGEWKC